MSHHLSTPSSLARVRRALTALLLLGGLTALGVQADEDGATPKIVHLGHPPYEEPIPWSEQRMFDLMTAGEHPLARLERVGHDYVYAESKNSYNDKDLQRRLKIDGFTLVESFRDTESGVAAMVLRDRNGKHVIAFRGTDASDVNQSTFDSDNAQNAAEWAKNRPVGFAQFKGHADVWEDWADRYGARGDLTVTGHSRGGGLAALFTAAHANRIEKLVTFQAPGQYLKAHKDFRKNMAGRGVDCTLVVAASDVIQLPGTRHLGLPKVIVALANEMGLGKLLGHTSFLLQNKFTTTWNGKPYRTAGDGLQRAEISYAEYARYRVRVNADASRFDELDVTWAAMHPALALVLTPKNFEVCENMLWEAHMAYLHLKWAVEWQNRRGTTGIAGADLNVGDLSVFDHLLPPEFHAFESEFYGLFRQMLIEDSDAVLSGARKTPRFPKNGNLHAYIIEHSVADLLLGLKRAAGGDADADDAFEGIRAGDKEYPAFSGLSRVLAGPIAMLGAPGPEETPASRYARMLRVYYDLQREAFGVLDHMFAAGTKLIVSEVQAGAERVSGMVTEVSDYLTDSLRKAAVDKKAANLPRPKGSGAKAQKAASTYVQQFQEAPSPRKAEWSRLMRAYEELHEDLFVGALTLADFSMRLDAWQQVSDAFWSAYASVAPSAAPDLHKRLQEDVRLYQLQIAQIDESFLAQARSRLAKLGLLYERFQDADIRDLLAQLQAELSAAEARAGAITRRTPGWFDEGGNAVLRSEAGLAGRAPDTPPETMAWLPSVVRDGWDTHDAVTDLKDRIADLLEDAHPKATREQDYVLGVIDFYVAEAARWRAVRAYAASNGGPVFPDGQTFQEQAFQQWIYPLQSTLEQLAALELRLHDGARSTRRLAIVAEERPKEVAFFHKAYTELEAAEKKLATAFSDVRARTRLGSGSATVDESDRAGLDWGDFVGPRLEFAGHAVCVERYACDGDLTTEAWWGRLAECFRVWSIPEMEKTPNTRLGVLLAPLSAHGAFLSQLPAAVAEIRRHAERLGPLQDELLALKRWRQQLDRSFAAHARTKPLLVRAAGNLPQVHAVPDARALEFALLDFAASQHRGRLRYMEEDFVPKARQLFADFAAEDERIQRVIDGKLARVRAIAEELEKSALPEGAARNARLMDAYRLINACYELNEQVMRYAPFKADYAQRIDPVRQQIKDTFRYEPPPPSGLVTGLVVDKASGAPLAGVTVAFAQVVNGDVRRSATIVTDADGQFSTNEFQPGAWDYAVRASGYQPFVGTIHVFRTSGERIVAALVRKTTETTGHVVVVLRRGPGAARAAVQVRITDLRGGVVAEGAGDHELEPGRYLVETTGRYLRTDPRTVEVRLFAGEVVEVRVAVGQGADEDDDDEEDDEADDEPPPPPRVALAVVDPCAEDDAFVRSLFRVVFEREASDGEVAVHVERLRAGELRALTVKSFLLSAEYQGLGKTGADFMRDAIQALYGRQPSAAELSAWPRMRRAQILDDMLRSVEHQTFTDGCAGRWRKQLEGDPDDGETSEDAALEEAQRRCQEAYNALTSLMAAGKGDTPEARAAHARYLEAREVYDRLWEARTRDPEPNDDE